MILSGPVGAGKTTVARDLIASAAGPAACIEGDVFWSFIVRSGDRGRRENFQMIMRAMLAAARHFERDGYEAIVDFSIPPWYLAGVRALLQGKPFDYVVLRPPEAVCAARAAARAIGAISDYTPYRDLYRSFDAAQPFIVAGDEAATSIAASIRAGLVAGTFRTS